MNEFEKASFRKKVSNMFIQYLIAISKGNIDDVLHFIKEQPRQYAEHIIDNLKKQNITQKYDELNTNNINMDVISDDKKATIYGTAITIDCLDYQLDKNNKVVSGSKDCKTMKTYFAKIIREKKADESGIIRRCPGCGHSSDVNYSGKCQYCGAIFNQEDYDYQILEIKEWGVL